MATCRRAGFTPDVHHLANTITTQLTMVACGLGVTLVPNTASPSVHRPLIEDSDLVELSLVTRSATDEPLVREFIRVAYVHQKGITASEERLR